MIRIRDIKIRAGQGDDRILDKIADILDLDKIYGSENYPPFSFEVLRRSVDGRKKPDIFLIFTVKLLIGPEDERKILEYLRRNAGRPKTRKNLEKILTDIPEEYMIPGVVLSSERPNPVIVGAGPAGLFCALYLARAGLKPVVIEQGEDAGSRKKRVEEFWRSGILDPYSNVQFGEGGAGTFSDGKLNTLTKDVKGRNTFVLKTLYEFGAPADITIDARPHIGTDILCGVVSNIRDEIIRLGGRVCFNTKLTGIGITDSKIESVTVTGTRDNKTSVIKTDTCVLAIGHSARDTFEMLYHLGIPMEQKSFAVGFRVIHPQEAVNMWQYGISDPSSKGLFNADYRKAYTTSENRRVYSFCMCPGGYVVNASSEEGRLCVNWMSESKRSGKYANSAIIAAVEPCDFLQKKVPKDHPLSGMYYQRQLEEEAFIRANGMIPVQTFKAFEIDEKDNLDPLNDPENAVKGGVIFASLRGIFSEDIDKAIIESMHKFGYTMKGFDDLAIFCGVESRTSSPVRITRGDDLMSKVRGLYPCGEGAGYAGGITSAAADGLKIAEMIAGRYES